MIDATLPAAVRALAADAASPASDARELALFGQFVGSWDVESTIFAADGRTTTRRCHWHFAWILGGRAIQDVLYADGASPAAYGTTLRSYDASVGRWRIAWMHPASGEFIALTAREEKNGIVLDGRHWEGDVLERWHFADITTKSFRWRGYSSRDGGASWVLEHEMRARRAE
jgi:hypothetical protein